MILIAPIHLDTAILPHFLRHYSELGFLEFHFAVNTKPNPKILREVEELSAGYPVHIDIVCAIDYTARAMTENLNAIRRQCAAPEQWISVMDLDEFYELPSSRSKLRSPISEFLELCDYNGYDHVLGRLVDRVASDGSFPELKPSPSLFKQFPLKRYLTRKLAGGDDRKIVLQKAYCKILGGHHRVRKGRSRADVELKVNHFKWKLGVVERLRERIEVLERAGASWAIQSHRLLAHINQHGCIDINDSRLFIDGDKRSRESVKTFDGHCTGSHFSVDQIDHRTFHVYQTDGFFLGALRNHSSGLNYRLASRHGNMQFPVNDSVALVWQRCHEPVLVTDLLAGVVADFPSATSIESDVLHVLEQLYEMGAIGFSDQENDYLLSLSHASHQHGRA